MKRENQIRALAEIDGIDLTKPRYTVNCAMPLCGGGYMRVDNWPDYLNDRNATHRIVRGMEPVVGEIYVESLRVSLNVDWTILSDEDLFTLLSASCEQVAEAALKAYGRWIEEDKDDI